jgi:hypothetical protein
MARCRSSRDGPRGPSPGKCSITTVTPTLADLDAGNRCGGPAGARSPAGTHTPLPRLPGSIQRGDGLDPLRRLRQRQPPTRDARLGLRVLCQSGLSPVGLGLVAVACPICRKAPLEPVSAGRCA